MKKPSNRPEQIDYAEFLRMVEAELPEVHWPCDSDESRKGLLHCEMAAFARLTEEKMDKGLFSQAEKYFQFISNIRHHAAPEVENRY